MFEPTEHEVDHDVRESMALFERAQVGEVAPIEPRSPGRILVVLDGSQQDKLSLSLASRLQGRFACPMDVLDAREWVDSNELAVQASQAIGAHPLSKSEGDSYEQILLAAEERGSELIIVPSPYGRDLEKVGTDSTGTVIDVLLARSSVPLLVTRRPFEPSDEPFAHAILVLIGENKAAAEAGAWAAGLVRSGGTIEVMFVLEQEVLQNVRRLMQELDPKIHIDAEQLSHALAQSHVRLHRALQKTAQDAGREYRLSVHRQGDAALEQLTHDSHDTLVVLALERADHLSHGHVHDRIRHTALPVLVVPRGQEPHYS